MKSPPNKYKNDLIEFIHFIKTPLASIKIGSDILKDVSPALIDAYKKQKMNLDVELSITDKKLDKLIFVIESILLEANRISKYIEKIELK